MLLFCHDPECTGAESPAGGEPEDPCLFCGRPLLDEDGCCIVGRTPLSEVRETTSLPALNVCCLTDHVLEGRVVDTPQGLRAAGRCSRCGVALVTAGD